MQISDAKLKKICEQCFVAGLNDWGNFKKFYNHTILPQVKVQRKLDEDQ